MEKAEDSDTQVCLTQRIPDKGKAKLLSTSSSGVKIKIDIVSKEEEISVEYCIGMTGS